MARQLRRLDVITSITMLKTSSITMLKTLGALAQQPRGRAASGGALATQHPATLSHPEPMWIFRENTFPPKNSLDICLVSLDNGVIVQNIVPSYLPWIRLHICHLEPPAS